MTKVLWLTLHFKTWYPVVRIQIEDEGVWIGTLVAYMGYLRVNLSHWKSEGLVHLCTGTCISEGIYSLKLTNVCSKRCKDKWLVSVNLGSQLGKAMGSV